MRFGLVSFNLLEQLGYFKIKMYDFNREMGVDYYKRFYLRCMHGFYV